MSEIGRYKLKFYLPKILDDSAINYITTFVFCQESYKAPENRRFRK